MKLLTYFGSRLWSIKPDRLPGLLDMAVPEPRAGLFDDDDSLSGGYAVRDGVAVFEINSVLFSRGDWLTAILGWTDYRSLLERVERAAADPTVRSILFDVSSPGGDAQELLSTMDGIRAAATRAGKPIVAYCAGAYSAACGLASVADRVFVAADAGMGSVGTMLAHVDQSAADAAEGFRVTFIHYGAKKVDGNSHQPLPDRVREDLQREVNGHGESFTQAVARYRKVPVSKIRGQEAGTYTGLEAVKAGLADEVGRFSSALAYARGSSGSRRGRVGASDPAPVVVADVDAALREAAADRELVAALDLEADLQGTAKRWGVERQPREPNAALRGPGGMSTYKPRSQAEIRAAFEAEREAKLLEATAAGNVTAAKEREQAEAERDLAETRRRWRIPQG